MATTADAVTASFVFRNPADDGDRSIVFEASTPGGALVLAGMLYCLRVPSTVSSTAGTVLRGMERAGYIPRVEDVGLAELCAWEFGEGQMRFSIAAGLHATAELGGMGVFGFILDCYSVMTDDELDVWFEERLFDLKPDISPLVGAIDRDSRFPSDTFGITVEDLQRIFMVSEEGAAKLYETLVSGV